MLIQDEQTLSLSLFIGGTMLTAIYHHFDGNPQLIVRVDTNPRLVDPITSPVCRAARPSLPTATSTLKTSWKL